MSYERIEEGETANDGDDLCQANGRRLFNGDALAKTRAGAGRDPARIPRAGQVVGDSGKCAEYGAPEVGRPERRDEKESPEEGQQEIDPLSLPYVMMSELSYLPDVSGIYFASDEAGEVLYIGQSKNIRHRWRQHHIQNDLCDLTSVESARTIRLAWLVVDDLERRLELERTFIRLFRPRYNSTYNCNKENQVPNLSIPAHTGGQLITTAEAAEKLGVHQTRVQVLIRTGRLPAQLIGGTYVIEESDLALVADRKPGRPKKAEGKKEPAKKRKSKKSKSE